MAESSAPAPGVAAPSTTHEAADRDAAARPLLGFVALLGGVLLLSAHEIAVRLPALYVATAAPAWRVPVALALGVGGAVGALVARRARRPELVLFGSSCGLAIALPLAVGVCSVALAAGGMPIAALSGAGGCGLLLAAVAVAATRVFARPARLIGIVEPALAPHHVLGGLVVFVAASVGTGALGSQRTALALGLLACVLALWSGQLAAWLGAAPPPRWRAWLGGAVFVGLLGALGARELTLPATTQLTYANEIVWGTRDGAHEIVVTSGQRNLELFVDGRLRVSGLDQHRYAEALVRPAMAAVERPRAVLVLGGGDGMLEREALGAVGVERVVVVSDSPVARYARRAPWLRALSRDALADPRVTVLEAEPIVWLGESTELWDVIVVDLPEPFGFLEAKSFTVGFYERLAARLARGGVAAIQALSAFASPAASASVQRALGEAGLVSLRYRAPVTTFGEWSFLLAGRDRPRVSGARLEGGRFLDPMTFEVGLVAPADTHPAHEVRPSTLHDQVIVDLLVQRVR
ncbi:MAG: hypothetical protein IT376_20325 [Polyangiaceae bacterium]|nr:hypothetical protein [Polyangiaceae bacterium]